ncbi:hypothetical protein [Sphingomonas sp. SRS2]|uniref:hypothetical protein n=1 Tax=Sphingomonas sp. SRS2 TaxID=133190 RepID=UPI0006184F1C|nr:hypothetical protein [Sphingomonas sp. SRS2]KKC23837.1 hypothetical protein WP12_22730 [Sphingomonas sp. SRS2]
MSRLAMIGAGFAAALLAAGQAQAGQDIPPPRSIRPIQPVFAAAPPVGIAAPHRWRETPPVMQGWSSDRHVAVVGFDRMSACEEDDNGWAGDSDEYAEFEGGDILPEWEPMR